MVGSPPAPPNIFLGKSTTSGGRSGADSVSSWTGLCELLERSGLWSGLGALLERSGLWSGLGELLDRNGSGVDSASSWNRAGSGVDLVRSWNGAGSGVDPVRSWNGAGSGVDSVRFWSGADSEVDSVSSWSGAGSGVELVETSEDEGGAGVLAGFNRELDSLELGMALLAVSRGLDSQGLKAVDSASWLKVTAVVDSASWLKVTVDSEMRLGLHGAGTGGRWQGAGTRGRCLGAGTGGHLRGTGTGEHLRGVEVANLGSSRDRGLDRTSRDGERLDGTSGGEGDPGVRMGTANSNGSAMSSSADSRGHSGSADSRGRSGSADFWGRSGSTDSRGCSCSAELDGTSGEDGELDVTSGDKRSWTDQRRFRSVLAKSWYWRVLWAGVSGGRRDSGSGSETLQTPDDRLLPIEVAGVGSSIGWWYVIPIRKSVSRTSPSRELVSASGTSALA